MNYYARKEIFILFLPIDVYFSICQLEIIRFSFNFSLTLCSRGLDRWFKRESKCKSSPPAPTHPPDTPSGVD